MQELLQAEGLPVTDISDLHYAAPINQLFILSQVQAPGAPWGSTAGLSIYV